eukprot:12186764-Heterocapsa_arctica.AAC.1
MRIRAGMEERSSHLLQSSHVTSEQQSSAGVPCLVPVSYISRVRTKPPLVIGPPGGLSAPACAERVERVGQWYRSKGA